MGSRPEGGSEVLEVQESREGIEHTIDFDLIRKTAESYKNLDQFIERVEPNEEGAVVLKPNGFILVETYEKLTLPLEGRLAARVKGW